MRPQCITVSGSILVEPLPPPSVEEVVLASDLQDGVTTVWMYSVGSPFSEWSAFIINPTQLINPKFNPTYLLTRIPIDEATSAIQITLLHVSFEHSTCNFRLEFNGRLYLLSLHLLNLTV
jgi:hypothetical protein